MDNLFKEFKNYVIKKIDEQNMYEVFNLYEKNIEFCQSVSEKPTIDTIKDAMTALPANTSMDKKYFLAFYKTKKIIAILDIIDGYPDSETAFIGLFMVDKNIQGQGIGKSIIKELLHLLKIYGYKKVRLGVVENSKKPFVFWSIFGFKIVSEPLKRENYNIIMMELNL